MVTRPAVNIRPGENGHLPWAKWVDSRLTSFVCATDYGTVQAAIDTAFAKGTQGSAVIFPAGTHTTAPLVLPKNPSASDQRAVQLIFLPGAILKGDAASFNEGDALISWQATATRAFRQSIVCVGGQATLDLPNVAGVRAIHYQPTAKATYPNHDSERLQIHVENLRILAHNDYHQELIYLEGTINRSVIRNIEGDPALGNGTYQTTLLKTDTNVFYSDPSGDAVGFNAMSLIENIYSVVVRGGRGSVFRGRINETIFRGSFGDGGITPSFEFVNSAKSTIEHISTEGRSEQPAMIVFDGCQFLQVRHIGIGVPNEYVPGDGYGHGMLLTNTKYCSFEGRMILPLKQPHSEANDANKKLLVIDDNCSNNVFRMFAVRVGAGGLSAEIEDNGTNNDLSGLYAVT